MSLGGIIGDPDIDCAFCGEVVHLSEPNSAVIAATSSSYVMVFHRPCVETMRSRAIELTDDIRRAVAFAVSEAMTDG